jgi:hypothetical protein
VIRTRIAIVAVMSLATALLLSSAPDSKAEPVHEVKTRITWLGPQTFIEFNTAAYDRTRIVTALLYGEGEANLIEPVRPGELYGADPIIGQNSYVSCTVWVDGVQVLSDQATAGDGHDCSCLRVMP